MSVLTDARVTAWGFFDCLLLSEPCKIYSHHCPLRFLSLPVNTFPTHIHPSPFFHFALFFACFSLKVLKFLKVLSSLKVSLKKFC